MTSQDLQQHRDRLETIRKSHWRQFESAQEHEDRADLAELAAARYFDQATVGQKAAYTRGMEDLRWLAAPRDDRAREAVKANWYASTANARALFEITLEDFMRDGELSAETAELWDSLPVVVDLREVA